MSNNYDVIIIGAGPGGYVAAIRAAQLKLKTLVIEKKPNLGGTCLNVGCIPSKTLLHHSEQFYESNQLQSGNGLEFLNTQIYPSLQRTKNEVIGTINQSIIELFKKNKIDLKQGEASFKNNHQLVISNKELVTGKHIIIATGAEPRELPHLRFDGKYVITSTEAMGLKAIPKKLAIVGAGVLGLELGFVFNRLGSNVTFIETIDQIGGAMLDKDISQALQKSLERQKHTFLLHHKVLGGHITSNGIQINIETETGIKKSLEVDVALVSIGRVPYVANLNLEAAGIERNSQGYITIDSQFKTSATNIYAIGDVAHGPPMLAHKASEEGVAVVELIAGMHTKINYSAIPGVVYTFPEVASVGLTLEDAHKQEIEVKVGSFPIAANTRAHCVDSKEGLVKIVADAKTDVVLGMHLVCEHAGELIAIGALAIEAKITAKMIGKLCLPHPTFSEAIKEAALAVHKKSIHHYEV